MIDVECQTELSGEYIDGLVEQNSRSVDLVCETDCCSVGIETDLSGHDVVKLQKEVEEMRLKMYDLRNDIERLKRELGVRTLSQNALQTSNKLLKFYTGSYKMDYFHTYRNT